MTSRQWALPVVAVALVAVGLRLALFVAGPMRDPQRAMWPDSQRYVDLSDNMLTYGRFASGPERTGVVHIPLEQLRRELGQLEPLDECGLRPEIVRTPGYPTFIAAFRGLGLSLGWVLAAQCVLSAVSVVLVYLLARRLLASHAAALAAAAIVALHPGDIVTANQLLSETLSITLMLAGLWLSLRGGPRRLWWPASGGALLGLSVLARPVTIFLGPAVAVWMVAADRRWRTVAAAVCVCAASLVAPAAWMARNARQTNLGFRISDIPYINGYFYTVAYMNMRERGEDYVAGWPAEVNRLMGELRREIRRGENVFAATSRLAAADVRARPVLFARTMTDSAAKFLTDHSLGSLYGLLGQEYRPTGLRDRLLGRSQAGHNGSLTALVLAAGWTGWNALLVLGAGAGCLRLLWRRQWATALLLAGVLLYFLLATQALGLERFRMPALGFQAIAVAALVARPRRALAGHAAHRRATSQVAVVPSEALPKAA